MRPQGGVRTHYLECLESGPTYHGPTYHGPMALLTMALLTMALHTMALLTMWHLNSLEDVDPYRLLTEDLAQSTRGEASTQRGSAALVCRWMGSVAARFE